MEGAEVPAGPGRQADQAAALLPLPPGQQGGPPGVATLAHLHPHRAAVIAACKSTFQISNQNSISVLLRLKNCTCWVCDGSETECCVGQHSDLLVVVGQEEALAPLGEVEPLQTGAAGRAPSVLNLELAVEPHVAVQHCLVIPRHQSPVYTAAQQYTTEPQSTQESSYSGLQAWSGGRLSQQADPP